MAPDRSSRPPRDRKTSSSRFMLSALAAFAAGAAAIPLAGGLRALGQRLGATMEGKRADREPEAPHVWTGRILLVLAGWTVFVAAGLYAMLLFVNAHVPVNTPFESVSQFPSPAIETDPQAQLTVLQSNQRQRLTGYAWVDRAAGLVHVPITRAMEAIAARGDHAFDPLEAAAGDDARGRAVEAAGQARQGRAP
ncbi:hypothetical protein [Consotaella salsifontis]|uniref:Uncharacterized protein n=1 Tax=Consotaella salsifontis TaxID=1365950 RepID=A0A1T4PP98_9HYPH|nr:hypothetical protein [Consotaella salsifontis]SJZ93076.1 hypothetical protein SAMN05428963_10475 [Consotaella salsifontis]